MVRYLLVGSGRYYGEFCAVDGDFIQEIPERAGMFCISDVPRPFPDACWRQIVRLINIGRLIRTIRMDSGRRRVVNCLQRDFITLILRRISNLSMKPIAFGR